MRCRKICIPLACPAGLRIVKKPVPPHDKVLQEAPEEESQFL